MSTIQPPRRRTLQLVTATTLLTTALLAGCGSATKPAGPPERVRAAAAAEKVYDDTDVLDHVGIQGPGDYPFGGGYLAEYRWRTPDGDLCPISNIITSADDAAMASDLVALNPAGTAGVELYDHTANAACIEALELALAGLK